MTRTTRAQRKSSKKSSVNEKKYIQGWLGIEDIKYGMIIIKDNIFGRRFVKIVEVTPINYHLMAAREQNMVISQFYSWLKKAPSRFQICLTTLGTDVSDMVNNIIRNTTDESIEIKKERNKYIDKIRFLSSREAIKKRCLIAFEYEGTIDRRNEDNLEQIAKEMNEVVFHIQHSFGQMGCRVITPSNENEFIYDVLYRYLNKRTSKVENVKDRIMRIRTDASYIQNSRSPEIDVNDYFMPRGLDTTHPEYNMADGIYSTPLYLDPKQYPSKVLGGWVDSYFDYGEKMDLSLNFVKRPRQQELASLKRGMRFKKTIAVSKSGDDEAQEKLAMEYSTSDFIRHMMRDEGEDLYDTAIFMNLYAESLNGLMDLKKNVLTDFTGDDLNAFDCYSRCEDAMKMVLPLCYRNQVLMKKASRNFLTSSIASTFPFTQYEMFDPEGVLFGLNGNGSLVSVNLFNTKMFSNANSAIIGSSGAGKSFTEQLLGRHLRLSGIKVMYVLPTKGHEYRRGCRAIGGQYVKLAPGSPICINIFEIRPEDNMNEMLIEGTSDFLRSSLRAKRLRQIKTFIQLLLGDEKLTIQEIGYIDEYLIRMYEEFGITDNDSSIFNENGEIKKMPTFSDFDRLISSDQRMERVHACIIPFISGSCKNMNGQTNIDLSNKYVVFDVDTEDIPSELHPAFLFLATDICYATIKANRSEEKVLFLDEVWKLMINRFSCEFVLELVKIVRGYGGACCIATQDVADFFSYMDGKYGRQIMNNAAISIVLKTKYDSVEYIKDILNLTVNERKLIVNQKQGQGLFITNKDRFSIYFTPTKEEMKLFSTDVNDHKETVRRSKEGNSTYDGRKG